MDRTPIWALNCAAAVLPVQRHGEHLSDGWTAVFRLLASVPSQKDAERIDLAFQSVQLTCSDYMAAMPYARMKRSLEVAAMYGSQQVRRWHSPAPEQAVATAGVNARVWGGAQVASAGAIVGGGTVEVKFIANWGCVCRWT
jgi:hypothetical protein